MQIQDIYNKHVSFIKVDNDEKVKYCPPQEIDATLLHPRVVLKFKNGIAHCPYCGLEYKLQTSE
jgi:uncharacterized Zn-finger protein